MNRTGIARERRINSAGEGIVGAGYGSRSSKKGF